MEPSDDSNLSAEQLAWINETREKLKAIEGESPGIFQNKSWLDKTNEPIGG